MDVIRVKVPGSKSITQRALVCAALAQGSSTLRGPLVSEDPILLKDALSSLGVRIDTSHDDEVWQVEGSGGRLGLKSGTKAIFMGNNGTGIRFLTALACLVREGEPFEIYGTKRMEERPIAPLVSALQGLGANIRTKRDTGCPPVVITPSQGLKGGETSVDASKSSQYLSALLLVAPYTELPTTVRLVGPLASSPYLEITLRVMEAFGIKVDVQEEEGAFLVPKGSYKACNYSIEGDASSASYFYAGAAITGRAVCVENVPSPSLQGDARFVDLLSKMGCSITRGPHGTTCQGPGEGGLQAIEVDMGDMPDMVPTLAAIAPFAQGETVITGCPHLRIKETDRISAMATELKKLGVQVRELPDGLVIKGAPGHLTPSKIHTYDDHRIAMSFAVVGLRVKGIEIEDPGCVKKSFPTFWEVWDKAFGAS